MRSYSDGGTLPDATSVSVPRLSPLYKLLIRQTPARGGDRVSSMIFAWLEAVYQSACAVVIDLRSREVGHQTLMGLKVNSNIVALCLSYTLDERILIYSAPLGLTFAIPYPIGCEPSNPLPQIDLCLVGLVDHGSFVLAALSCTDASWMEYVLFFGLVLLCLDHPLVVDRGLERIDRHLCDALAL